MYIFLGYEKMKLMKIAAQNHLNHKLPTRSVKLEEKKTVTVL
jgi:hypothetical protein